MVNVTYIRVTCRSDAQTEQISVTVYLIAELRLWYQSLRFSWLLDISSRLALGKVSCEEMKHGKWTGSYMVLFSSTQAIVQLASHRHFFSESNVGLMLCRLNQTGIEPPTANQQVTSSTSVALLFTIHQLPAYDFKIWLGTSSDKTKSDPDEMGRRTNRCPSLCCWARHGFTVAVGPNVLPAGSNTWWRRAACDKNFFSVMM